MNKAFKRLELLDSIFLLILVFVSALPWVGELGFYSDDWSYLAALRESAPAGLSAMFRSLVHTDSGLLVRPVQLACLVLEFKAFGLHPLPYHLLIAALLGATVVLLYVVLRASSIARCYSVAMAIIFAFLPQYSTDRFWLSSQQTLLCMLFALAGIAAMLRYASPSGSRKAPWLAAASTCFVASILSYEVALGIIVASIVVVAWRTFRRSSGEHRALSILPPLGVALPIVLFGLLKILFQHRYVLHHRIPLFWLRGEIWKLAAFHAFQFNLGNYVFRLPSVLASLYRQSAITAGSAAAAAAVTILLTLYFWRFQDESQVLTRLAGFKAIAFGLVLFGLGYALFSPVPGTAFESAGLNNRITIASALGASCVIVGLITLVCMVAQSFFRLRMFAVLVALTCASYSIVCNGISFFWIDAASKQAAVLRNIRTNVTAPPQQSTFLLDGFCQYSGPAVVFDTDWDTTGALRILFSDPTLTADVVSKDMQLNRDAVDTFIGGDLEGHYLYGERLFVYNTRAKILSQLSSQEAAEAYLHRFNQTNGNGCPPAQAEDGVSIF